MSRIFSAGQYEQDYLPERLGNWQLPDKQKQQTASTDTRYSTLQGRKGTTKAIADDNGHLLPGVKKAGSAFRTQLSPGESAAARWPKPAPFVRSAPAATMGYKGIVTTYLPPQPHSVQGGGGGWQHRGQVHVKLGRGH